MQNLRDTLAPYLDEEEGDYPPSLCLAIGEARRRTIISESVEDMLLAAIRCDEWAAGWDGFRVTYFVGTRAERVAQWRTWAEGIIEQVQKELDTP